MRFHIVSLPHTQTTAEYCWCAYTAKVRRFCNMMTSLGHEVFLYAGTENEARVTELITVVTDYDRNKWFGDRDWNKDIFGDWNGSSECWMTMNVRAADEIRKRKKPNDFLGIIGGRCQEYLKSALPDMQAVEWGVGYEGIFTEFRVFESNAWMHYLYGRMGITDGKFYDTVIPNSFEENEFSQSVRKDDYYLFLGRQTPRKGIEVIRMFVEKGYRVVTAGQGEPIPGTEFMGVVRGEVKKKLLGNARAVLVPTFYIEPFGGVAVEAMLSGTPVITTDFGAFTETVEQGVTGFRCSTMADFYAAAERVGDLDPVEIYEKASYYLTDNIKFQYDFYFKRLLGLNGPGWYAE